MQTARCVQHLRSSIRGAAGPRRAAAAACRPRAAAARPRRHLATAEAAAVPPARPAWEKTPSAILRPAAVDALQKASAAPSYDHVWLRDSCPCERCVDASTSQKLFQSCDIPLDIAPADITTLADGSLQIRWTKDVKGYDESHVSVYSPQLLNVYSSKQAAVEDRIPLPVEQPWNKAMMDRNIHYLDYHDYMTFDAVVLKAVEQLSLYGLVFLSNVPPSEESVVSIGTRIAPLRDTFYGRTWDVKSVPQAKNIAYTSQFLGFHMDLLYMSNPPGIQLLHCIKNSCEGGASLFSDAFHAAEKLRQESPEHFKTLCEYDTTYHYRNANQHYLFKRPTIELEEGPLDCTQRKVDFINWSPPFQGPFEFRADHGADDGVALRKYIAAANAFSTVIEQEDSIFEYKMEEGDCVIFNNRRALHARRAFDTSSGERWLKGAYLDTDAFKSRYRVLREQHPE